MAKILIVDDSETMRRVLKSFLTPDGHEIVEAEDGVVGLAKFLQSKDVALVLTDVNMPNMDGITLCERLRQTEAGKSVNIFVISTEGNDVLKSKAKSLGVRAWMTKPPAKEKLIQAVNMVLTPKE